METEIILYVSDLQKSKCFYSATFGKNPDLDVEGMVEFQLHPGIKLGLMPENGIARIICPATPHPSIGKGIPRCELYLKDPVAFNYYNNSLKAGALIISEPSPRSWGDMVAYVADPDGHILAFAKT